MVLTFFGFLLILFLRHSLNPVDTDRPSEVLTLLPALFPQLLTFILLLFTVTLLFINLDNNLNTLNLTRVPAVSP